MKAFIRSAIIIFLLIFLTPSCRKFDKPGKMNEAGVALTFDDDYIENWYKYLPVLDSMGVKATFYISKYHNLTPAKVQKLKTIEAHGNEIGFHTTNHINIPKYVDKYGTDQLISHEINPDLIKMKQDGFNPVVFAYPYGSHTSGTNNLLLRYFKSIRALNGTQNFARSLTSSNDETILYAMEIDNSARREEWMYDELLNSAKENGNCFVLVGHRIEEGNTKMKVPLTRLLHIINKAKKSNMKFYTISEISRK